MGELNETSQFLIRHGLPLVFAVVFVEQMGLPIPALPVLLAAGALSGTGKFNLLLGIVATVVACLIADAIWFYLQRNGFTRVRPLVGGIDAWREGNHPMEVRTGIVTNTP